METTTINKYFTPVNSKSSKFNKKYIAYILFAFLLFATHEAQSLSFDSITVYMEGRSNTGKTLGDIDGDGVLDLVVSSPYVISSADYNNQFNYAFGNGDGSFGTATKQDHIAGYSGGNYSILLADVNNDTKLDVIESHGGTTGRCFGDRIAICLGTGSSFNSATFLTGNGSVTGIVTCDFDSDTKVDIVCEYPDGNSMKIHWGNGDGTFASPTTVALGIYLGARCLRSADLDGDTRDDLIFSRLDGNAVSVILGNGTRTVGTRSDYSVSGSQPYGIAVADFNGDGKHDVVSANSGDGSVSFIPGNGDGTFGTASNYAIGLPTNRTIEAADFDNDGKMDIAIGGGAAYACIRLGNGDGTFGSAYNFNVNQSSAYDIAVGDLNNDGWPDLVSGADGNSDVITALLNTTGVPIGDWLFLAGIGGTAFDSSGNNLNGALYNSPLWAGPPPAIDYDGTDDYVMVPDASPLDITGSITMSVWIRRYRNGWGSDEYIMGKAKANENSYSISITPANSVKFMIANSGISPNNFTSTGVINDFDWHHIATTYDGANMKIYIDGSLNVTGGAASGNIHSGLANLCFGANGEESWGFFEGQIGHAMLFDYAMDSAAVYYLFGEDSVLYLDTIPPDPLVNFSASTMNSQTGIYLSWDKVTTSDAELIRFRYRTDGIHPTDENDGTFYTEIDLNVSGFVNYVLQPGTWYYFAGFVKDLSGNWSIGATASAPTLDSTVPNPLNNFRATPISNSHIDLSWDPPADNDADTIYIWYKEQPFEPIDTGISLSVPAPPPGQIYIDAYSILGDTLLTYRRGPNPAIKLLAAGDGYKIANTDCSCGSYWDYLSGIPIGSPTACLKRESNGDLIKIHNVSLSADSVQMNLDIFGEWKNLVELEKSQTSYSVTDLENKKKYHFTAFVKDSTNNWGTCALDSAITLDFIPPDNDMTLIAIPIDTNKVVLSWNPSAIDATDADSVGIWYQTGDFPDSAYDPNAILRGKYTLSDSVDTVTGLAKATTYYFSIMVRDSTGNWSDTSSTGNTTGKTFSYANLVAYYPFTGNANDMSGNGNDGTVNGAVLATDRFSTSNSAYNFDAIDDYIDCGNNPSLNITNKITISAWIKQNSYSNRSTILSKWVGSAGGRQYMLQTALTGELFFQVRDNSDAVTVSHVGTTQISLATFYFVAAVYDGTAQIMDVYINGIKDATTKTSGVPSSLFSTNSNLNIGAYNDGASEKFDGIIDDIRIYNRALNSAEIDSLYSLGSWPAPTVVMLNPADNSTNVGINDSLVIVFSEAVTAGAGKVTIKKSSDNTVFCEIWNEDVTGGGTNTITIVTNIAFESETGYYVLIDSTFFVDAGGNKFAGINSNTAWNFSTGDGLTEKPILSVPANGSTIGDTFTIDFSLPENALSGSVKMSFIRMSGTSDPNSPHIITFNSSTPTSLSTVLYGTDLSANPFIASVSSDPNDVLVKDAIYSVVIEYQDVYGNAAARDTSIGVLYTGGVLGNDVSATLTNSGNNAIIVSLTRSSTPISSAAGIIFDLHKDSAYIDSSSALMLYYRDTTFVIPNITTQGMWYGAWELFDSLGNIGLMKYDSIALGNIPPVLSLPSDTSIYEDTAWTIENCALDQNGDQITLVLVSAPPDMYISQTNLSITWTPDNDDVGIHVVRVAASDVNGGVDTASMAMQVLNTNDYPVIYSAYFPDTVYEDSLLQGVINISDPDDGDSVFLTLNPAMPWLSITLTQGSIDSLWQFTIRGIPDNANTGLIQFNSLVSDKEELVVTGAHAIYVINTNDPPQTFLNKKDLAYGAVLYNVKGIDDFDTVLTFCATITDSANRYDTSMTNTNGLFPIYPLLDGRYFFSCYTKDKDGLKDLTPFEDTIIVSQVTTHTWSDSGIWDMVSIPVSSCNAASFKSAGVILHWDESRDPSNIYKYYIRSKGINELTAGNSYWTRLDNTVSVSLNKDSLCKDSVAIYLHKSAYGWNQIASPYPYPVRWNKLGPLWEWDPINRDFIESTDGTMYPWHGYWVLTEASDTVNLSPAPVFVSKALTRLKKTCFENKREWTFGIELTSNINRDADNLFGVSRHARDGYDALDRPEPPRMGNEPYLFFAHPEWKRSIDRFASDIRKSWDKGKNIFQIGISPCTRDVTALTLNITGFNEDASIYLFVNTSSGVVEYKPGMSLAIEPSKEEQYRTIFATGDKDFLNNFPHKFILNNPYPNPCRPATTIRYTLPYNWGSNGWLDTKPYKVKMVIYDARGRVVRELVDRKQGSGNYRVVWRGKSDTGRRVASGFYFCRLIAGKHSSVKKIIAIR